MEDKDEIQSSYTQAVGANDFHQAKHLLTRQYLAFHKAFPKKCYCPVNNHKEPKKEEAHLCVAKLEVSKTFE